MRHVRMLGLCLVAVFALVAVAASSASAAEPEWGHCIAKKKSVYSDSNCQNVATKHGLPDHKGAYEWIPGSESCYPMKKGTYTESACLTVATKHGLPDHKGSYEKTGGGKFTSAGGAAVLKMELISCVTENGPVYVQVPREDCVGEGDDHEGYEYFSAVVECEGEHASGESTGTDEVTNVSVRFTGCASFGVPATSEGLPAGEIQVNPLKGRLGYIAGKGTATPTVGVLLEPATAGGEFAKFGVLEGWDEVHVGVGNATTGAFYEGAKTPGVPNGHDGIISPIVPVDQMTHTFTQKYKGEESEVPCPENCPASFDGKMPQYQNVPGKFEGGQLEALEGYLSSSKERWATEPEAIDWGSVDQEVENTNTVEGEAEIKA